MHKDQEGLRNSQFAWRLTKKSCSVIAGCISLTAACIGIFIFFSGFQTVWEIFSPQNVFSHRLSVEVVRFVGDVYIVENGEKRLILSGENASEAAISPDEKRIAIIGSPHMLAYVIHILDVDGNNHKEFFFYCSALGSDRIENLSWPNSNKVRVYFECIENTGEIVNATIEKFPIVAPGYYDLNLDEHNGLLEIQPFR